MKIPFDTSSGLIIIDARLYGAFGETFAQLALDTGATFTVINTGKLVSAGYDPAVSPERVQLTTGSGVEYAARIQVQKLVAIGQERTDFSLVAHTMPPLSGVDGVLGLDFLRGRRLVIDFRKGEITLE